MHEKDVDTSATAFLTLPKAAEYLGITANTLYIWRHRRQGPPSFRMGRRVMYRVSSLNKWIAEQERADSRSNESLNPISRRAERRHSRRSN
ncbi:helix-turn-helix transcriptional regulator [Streptomyces hainanensis]|uniref:DNA-binding protein n=1 Tax=Streptomyces hainanensis TaxID=402648 RepID=A0A4R4T9T0_9ACTN|nr:helix-turn-helix domain-containing protein [Streptomyces hainanensis]TDC72234.1 DNA-binding protein [Streptomyces hainanensis]